MNDPLSQPLLMYLLHFEKPVDKRRHYIGSTRHDRLARRMHEHASGLGSKTTKTIIRAGGGFWLTRLWSISSRAEEYRRKRQGHYEYSCSICQSGEIPLTCETYWAPVKFEEAFKPTAWDDQLPWEVKSSGPRRIGKPPVFNDGPPW